MHRGLPSSEDIWLNNVDEMEGASKHFENVAKGPIDYLSNDDLAHSGGCVRAIET